MLQTAFSALREVHPFSCSSYDFRFSAVASTVIEPGLLLSSVVSLVPRCDCLLASMFRASFSVCADTPEGVC